MNAKYAKKPIPNPNEPIEAKIENRQSKIENWNNEPNFKTQKTLISRQKRRNGGQKPTQKNETNPILTGA
jgi:hypothetical protein